MSWSFYLTDPVSGEVLLLDSPHHMKGGTYAIGGTTEMHLNITYNYSEHYYTYINEVEGIRWLYGRTAAETIPVLKTAIACLGDDVDRDYWKPTEGNAKRALIQLLALAQMRPDGIWNGE